MTAVTAEDPFGPGDPLEVARLIRRVLAAACRRAVEVSDVVVIADATPSPDTLGRFVRRALGPQGEAVRSASIAMPESDHRARKAAGMGSAARNGMTIAVVIGPGELVSVLCVEPPSGPT